MANQLKNLDAFQVLRSVYDVNNNCLRVCVVSGSTGDGGGFEVIITHTDDSIRLGDGTKLTTATSLAGKVGLDVNVINEVDIRDLNASTDNVAISDGVDQLEILPDGSINVNALPSSNATSVNKYGEVSSVASGIETTMITHIAVGGRKTYLQRVDSSGENIADYKVKVNGVTIDRRRTNFGDNLNAEFIFEGYLNPGLEIAVGAVVTVTVIHSRGSSADFNGKIQLLEVI